MNKRIASLVLVGALGLGTAGVALTPALADTAPGKRVTHFTDALKSLVADGTLTQAQADKVATTLDSALPKGGPHGGGRHGGPKAHLRDAAAAIGVTPAELRAALESGKSLADVAATKGLTKAALIDKLLAPAKTRLAARVAEGELTQAQADARLTAMRTRVTDLVDRKGLPMRPDKGMGKHHDRAPVAS